MVHKIQYGTYHGELSCYFGFNFLIPLSDCNKERKCLTEEKTIME